MARRYAPLLCTIWDDPDFQQLTPPAQRAYVLLMSQRKMSMVGVVPYTPRAWSRGSVHTTTDDMLAAVAELADNRYVVIDESTDELLIRTMVKHDPPKGPKSIPAMWRSFDAVESEALRWAIAAEVPDEVWDDEKAPPPGKVVDKYRSKGDNPDPEPERTEPLQDPPSDGGSHGGADGARTRAQASSVLLPPSSSLQPPATDQLSSSSVSTVVGAHGNDDDDDGFVQTVRIYAQARVDARNPKNPTGYRRTVEANARIEHADEIREQLTRGRTPLEIAARLLDSQLDARRAARKLGLADPNPDPPGYDPYTGAVLADEVWNTSYYVDPNVIQPTPGQRAWYEAVSE